MVKKFKSACFAVLLSCTCILFSASHVFAVESGSGINYHNVINAGDWEGVRQPEMAGGFYWDNVASASSYVRFSGLYLYDIQGDVRFVYVVDSNGLMTYSAVSEQPFSYMNCTFSLESDGKFHGAPAIYSIHPAFSGTYGNKNFYYMSWNISFEAVLQVAGSYQGYSISGTKWNDDLFGFLGAYLFGAADLKPDDEYVSPPDFDDQNPDISAYDKELGYLRNVRYLETKNVGKERTMTLKWDVQTGWDSSYHVQINCDNFFTKWLNNTTSEHWTWIDYTNDLLASAGSYSVGSPLAPARLWGSARGYDTSPGNIKMQTYGTTAYYLRLVRFNQQTGKYTYGGWVKVDIRRGSSTELPISGVETGIFDPDTGKWMPGTGDDDYGYVTDSEGQLHMPVINGSADIGNINVNSLAWVWTTLTTLVGQIGEVPNIVARLFAFLPSWVPISISVGIGGVIIMRFVGR